MSATCLSYVKTHVSEISTESQLYGKQISATSQQCVKIISTKSHPHINRIPSTSQNPAIFKKFINFNF